MTRRYFGTDGIRGRVGEEPITPELVLKLGWAAGLVLAADTRGNGAYLSVRFGNVLGSRGSVLTTFRAQISAGGPVTVTHPEVSRYFMTIEEAVQLVIQAGAIGSGGEVLVLEMGDQVRITDLARRLIEQADAPIEIVYTGLREGEKVQEVLVGRGEVSEPTSHALINRVSVPPLRLDALPRLDRSMGEAALVMELRNLSVDESHGDVLQGEPLRPPSAERD